MNIDTRIESNRLRLSLSLSLLFPFRGNATTKNNRSINARKKESSSGQSKREEEEEDGREKTNRLHFYAIEFEPLTSQLVITVGEFQNDGTHTHTSIFQTEPKSKRRKEKIVPSNNFDTLLDISFCFALCVFSFLWYSAGEKSRLGKRSEHRKALISSILQKYLPYHLTLFTRTKAHQMQNNVQWALRASVRMLCDLS